MGDHGSFGYLMFGCVFFSFVSCCAFVFGFYFGKKHAVSVPEEHDEPEAGYVTYKAHRPQKEDDDE